MKEDGRGILIEIDPVHVPMDDDDSDSEDEFEY